MNVEDLYWVSFILITLISFFTYKLLTRYRNFFKRLGIAYEKPHYIYGNLNDVISGKLSSLENAEQFYRKFSTKRIFGFYNYLTPTFYITDPALIRKLWVQEFDHFADHGYFLDESKDAILGNQLHLLKGDKWRQMRHTLAPVFASRSISSMSGLVRRNSSDLCAFLKSNTNGDVDLRSIFIKHTFNLIANCAFGVELNTFHDESNRFCSVASGLVFANNPIQTLKTIAFYLAPGLMRSLKVRLMEADHVEYFTQLFKNTIRERNATHKTRPDMVQLLSRANEGELKLSESDDEFLQMKDFSKRKWTEEMLLAQCVAFFGTGFEALMNLLAFACYELAVNADVQQRLVEELDEVQSDVTLTYERLQSLKYLDMVVQETLRKWPVYPAADRQCTKDYLLQDGELKIPFRKGDNVWVSIWALHRNPEHFPDPERFDPERFNERNHSLIRSYTYLPFGVGGRNCVGRHFAMLTAKVTLVDMLKSFRLSPGERTQQPLRLAKGAIALEPEGGFWIQMTPR